MEKQNIQITLSAVEEIKDEILNEVEGQFYTLGIEKREQWMKEQRVDELLKVSPKTSKEVKIKMNALGAVIKNLNEEIAFLKGYAGWPDEELLEEYRLEKNTDKSQKELSVKSSDLDWFN